ncbi:hypothetical protein [Dankookia sp. P2]|uniref:hypothetical protein n=1 Tax=Dankookia sp. P2 TaxID=3423955 RepID=UPI003D665A47
MKAFKAPKTSLGDLDAEAAALLITAAADIAIIVDASGAVRDVAFNSEGLGEELAGQDSWLGRPWTETVAPDSRAKVESLLAESGRCGGPAMAAREPALGPRRLRPHPVLRGADR